MNAMTIDVEDWFQVQAYDGVIARADWEGLPRRVEHNTHRLLEVLDAACVQATFFTLGWVAERHPKLIRFIVAAGHELASHGYWHHRVDRQDAVAFRRDVTRARACLEDAGGCVVRGYRAPTFSIGAGTPWAWDVLAETGHSYSSSVFPVRHDRYGSPDAPRRPNRKAGGAIWEIPPSTLRLASWTIPCGGGGWFRALPYTVFRAALRRAGQADAAAGVFYIHPWEIDPGQPRFVAAPASAMLRHRLNLNRTEPRLTSLLRDFRWGRMDAAFPQVGA